MVSGRRFGSLDKFLELTPEHIVHFQSPCNFLGDVQAVRASRIKVRFLQDKNVRICTCKKFYDTLQLLTAVDVPVNNA